MSMYEILSYDEAGYSKVFSYLSWRIAILNHIDELELDALGYVECHHETDEAFILLEGNCTLIFARTDENHQITGFETVELEKNKIFIVKKGVYHSHILSKECKVVVIEEENTCYENSHRIYFDDENKQVLTAHINGL